MCRWRDIIAGSSAPISPIGNLFSQSQDEIASTGKQIVMVGRPEVLSPSLPSFWYRLSVVFPKSLNVSKQNCNVYWSKVWIQLAPRPRCAIYRTAVPLMLDRTLSLSIVCVHHRLSRTQAKINLWNFDTVGYTGRWRPTISKGFFNFIYNLCTHCRRATPFKRVLNKYINRIYNPLIFRPLIITRSVAIPTFRVQTSLKTLGT